MDDPYCDIPVIPTMKQQYYEVKILLRKYIVMADFFLKNSGNWVKGVELKNFMLFFISLLLLLLLLENYRVPQQ